MGNLFRFIIENIRGIFELWFFIFSIYIAFKAILYRVRSGLTTAIVTMIQTLEGDSTMTGKEKMAALIAYLRDLMPRIFHVIFTDKVLEQIAQNIFDDMKRYSDNRSKNLVGVDLGQLKKMMDKRRTTESGK